MLGPGDWTTAEQPTTPKAILEAMGRFGISEALVRDSLGEIGDACAANLAVVEHTRSEARLHPVWTILPPRTRDVPPPEEMLHQMRDSGVAAAWLPYGAFGLPLEDWCVDQLLGPLAESRVPVFVSPLDRREGEAADQTDWRGLVRICRAFPDLPVVLTESRIYKTQRALFAALEACPNLHVDLSVLWLHRIIELVCREFGPRRLVFGSQLPYRDPGAVIMQLSYADVSASALALIAGGRIREMISWNPSVQIASAPVMFPAPMDPLHRAARDRADLSGESFYDCHGHVGFANQRHVVCDSPAELVREMDRFGLRVCCVFTWIGGGNLPRANDQTFQAVKHFPDRFVGFTALNPNHGQAEAESELKRGLAHGMRGIKLVSSIHRYPSDGPIVDSACRFAHEHRQFILNHTWGPPSVMATFCRKYPNACFITGHSEGSFAELVREFDNLHICSCPFLRWGQTEEYVRLYGADRILFGSDLLDLPIGWGLGPILYARIPESSKRLMLGGNLQRLLARYGNKG